VVVDVEVVDDVVAVDVVVDVVVVDVTISLVVVIMVVVIVVVVVVWLQPLIQSSTFSLSSMPGPLMQHLQASVKEQV